MKICFGWLGRILSYGLMALPLRARLAVGDFLGFLWFDVLYLRRRVIDENIQKAFPEMSSADRKKLGRRSVYNMGRTIVEYAELPFLNRARVEKILALQGEEHLRKAMERGRGTILLTLHMGNGDLVGCSLAQLGYPFYLVSKEFKLKWLHDLWFGLRERLGVKLIPPRNSSYAILKALKRNGVIGFVQDQFTGPPIGVKTTFFGHETGTALGLAMMAERSGAAVVPAYCYRDENGLPGVCFEPHLEVKVGENRDEDLLKATQSFNHILERFIRQKPEQWMWVHRRWKRYVVH